MERERHWLADGALYTDHYQLTMAQLYFRQGIHENEARFEHFFRRNPDYGAHQAGFCVNAGMEWLLDWMDRVRFGRKEIDHLRTLVDAGGSRLFQEDFLSWLQDVGDFSQIHLSAIPEGRVVHPNVPLTVVRGPLAVAQILETSLLNHLNYPILVATRAARLRESAGNATVLEFGMRRAHERGANAGGRAALVGGADYSSNVGLSAQMGVPSKGTHAHAMVQAFLALGMDELDAFRAYAELYPDDCLLLVDTIDTLESGVPNAIRVFEELRRRGHRPVGIRLDSGDLAYLSIRASLLLDAAGFEEVSITLSNSLDELVIWQITTQIRNEAARFGVDAEKVLSRLVYGVGTRLITSSGSSALGGVYKLVAITNEQGWRPAIKISESREKTPNPGNKRAWRIYDRSGRANADLLTLDDEDPKRAERLVLRNPSSRTHWRVLHRDQIQRIEPLLEEVRVPGQGERKTLDLETLRERRRRDVEALDGGVRRLINPHVYHVSLSQRLWDLKDELIRSLSGEEEW